MSGPVSRPLPERSLLSAYRAKGDYTDCFTIDVVGQVSQRQFVEAFYTSRLFKLERFILRWLVAKPSTDAEAARLAEGQTNRFAAWTVEGREQDQLLLCDYQGQTRSWLMVESMMENSTPSTRLFFGSAVVAATNRRTGRKSMPVLFRLLLGFHRRYARALLKSAAGRLSRP